MDSQQVLNRIKGKRNEKGITQDEMALKLGITQKTYNLKENGKAEFTLAELSAILVILGCNFDDIFLP
jgi:putative transcriptional regulator